MKKVVKVSIGSLAFTLEEDAFNTLNFYLNDLKSHYNSKPNGSEIIEGIEERIADLFMEKNGKDNVVPISIVNEVIAILGKPDDFDEEESTQTNNERTTTIPLPAPKKLFRDTDNKVLGGVCSGLGVYFNIDRVLVRIIFLVLLIGFSLLDIHFGGTSAMVLIYIGMWILVPEAKTIEQKCAMHGETPDINNIKRRVEDYGSNYGRGNNSGNNAVSAVFKAILKVIGVILILIGGSGLISLAVALLGFQVFDGMFTIDLIDFVNFGDVNITLLKVLGLAVIFLPFIGMLYGGIQLLFGFKSPKYKPGLIIFLLWIFSCIGLAFTGVSASRGFWQKTYNNQEFTIEKMDTIYVKYVSNSVMPEKRVMLEADEDDFNLFWVDKKGSDLKLVVFPNLIIDRIAEGDSSNIKTSIMSFAETWADASVKASKNLPKFEMKDSLLTIYADEISKTSKWDGSVKKISLRIPENTKVIVKEPIYHDFETHREISCEW